MRYLIVVLSIVGLGAVACSQPDPRQEEADRAYAICMADEFQRDRACSRVYQLLQEGFVSTAVLEENRDLFINRWTFDRFPDSPRNVEARVVLGEIVVCGEVRIPSGQWRRAIARQDQARLISPLDTIVEGLSAENYVDAPFSEALWEGYCE